MNQGSTSNPLPQVMATLWLIERHKPFDLSPSLGHPNNVPNIENLPNFNGYNVVSNYFMGCLDDVHHLDVVFKLYVKTLRKKAYTRFQSLPDNSIKSFPDLRKSLLNKY